MSRSADAVVAGEARGEEADQEGSREADHVQVVAFGALDERGAEALDRIRAGAVLPLAARDVGGDVARGHGAERHAGDLVLDLLPAGRDQTEPRDDLVR